MNYKKLCTLLIGGTLLLSGCTQNPEEISKSVTQDQKNNKYSIVASTFYEYDWIMQILGENKDKFNVTLLTDSGVDLHSYAPTAADIVTITSADLFVYNGGHSHSWVDDVIAEPTNDKFRAINIMKLLGDEVKAEVSIDGMDGNHDECSHEHDGCSHEHDEHSHEHDEHSHEHDKCSHEHDEHSHSEDCHEHDDCCGKSSDGHSGHNHDDEHVWLSLNNAMIVCNLLGESIGTVDQENADTYRKNAAAYVQKLEDLDQNYEDVISSSEKDTLIFADRFPFLYLMDDYDLNYFAAFQGCSAETEASFETVAFLAEKVNELDIDELLIIDSGLIELANTINSSTDDKDCEILTLHSMQSVSGEDIDNGATYYKFMENNLKVIEQALN